MCVESQKAYIAFYLSLFLEVVDTKGVWCEKVSDKYVYL